MRQDGERIGVYKYLLDTQRSLLFLDLISFCSRGRPVLVLCFGALLPQTPVYQVLGIVTGACSFVHEALCMAFFESGNDVLACWIPLLDQLVEKRCFVNIGPTHSIQCVQMRMHFRLCGE